VAKGRRPQLTSLGLGTAAGEGQTFNLTNKVLDFPIARLQATWQRPARPSAGCIGLALHAEGP